MKALTQQELQDFVSYFSLVLEGCQLQDVIASDRGLALGFHRDMHYWLVLDLVPNSPLMLLFAENCPFKKGPKAKPVGLFLNSHGRNLYFSKLEVVEQLGRVVRLTLKNSQLFCEIEMRLIPKQCNVIVKAQGKEIAWDKPLPLNAAPIIENLPAPRSIEEIHNQWLAEQKSAPKPAQDPVAQWEKQKNKDLEKKKKALTEIEKQIESSEHELWSEVGQFLKTQGHLDVPDHLVPFVQRRESLSWNIEHAFNKAKQLTQKKVGARERQEEIKQEILRLEKATYQKKMSHNSLDDLMQKTEARGRKLILSSGALAYCGRSASDNLALLRQAKAWDYWLHLRDYPGAHGIIHRQREQVISTEEIQEVAEWVAKESLGSKSLIAGQKVAVVMVECRFVRPIKGDKLGRVTYHSERSFSFTLRHP